MRAGVALLGDVEGHASSGSRSVPEPTCSCVRAALCADRVQAFLELGQHRSALGRVGHRVEVDDDVRAGTPGGGVTQQRADIQVARGVQVASPGHRLELIRDGVAKPHDLHRDARGSRARLSPAPPSAGGLPRPCRAAASAPRQRSGIRPRPRRQARGTCRVPARRHPALADAWPRTRRTSVDRLIGARPSRAGSPRVMPQPRRRYRLREPVQRMRAPR